MYVRNAANSTKRNIAESRENQKLNVWTAEDHVTQTEKIDQFTKRRQKVRVHKIKKVSAVQRIQQKPAKPISAIAFHAQTNRILLTA